MKTPTCPDIVYHDNIFYNIIVFDTETNATGRAAELCQLSAVDKSDHCSFSEYILPNNCIDKYASSTVADKGHSHTRSEITPQYHETRHNSTIRATISRFTPQFHDSRHNFTIHTTKKPLTNHSLNIH
jgi:hypothetical protein